MSDSISLRRSAISGAAWTAGQVWGARLLSAATFVVLGRTLLPSAFGVVALAFAIIAVLTTLGESGLSNYLVRRAHLDDGTTQTVFWTGLALGVAFAALLAVSAGTVADAFGFPALAQVLPVLAIGMVITSVGSVPAALMRREMRFKQLALRGTVATFVGSVVAIVAALSGAGVWALVAQFNVAALASTVVVWAGIRWRPRATFRRDRVVEMLSFGTKLMLIDLMTQSRDRAEEFILAGLYSPAALGFWSVASRLVKLLQDSGTQVVNAVATPILARVQDDPRRLFRGYELSMASAGVVLFPTMLFIAATAPDLIPFVFGSQWVATAQVAQISALSATVGVFTYFDRSLCVAVNKLRAEMFLTAFIILTHIVIVVVVARYGLRELAVALLVRQVLTFPVRQLVLHRVVGAPYRCLLLPGRVLLAAIGAAIGVLLLNLVLSPDIATWLRLLADATVVVVVYPLLLMVLAREMVQAALNARRTSVPAV